MTKPTEQPADRRQLYAFVALAAAPMPRMIHIISQKDDDTESHISIVLDSEDALYAWQRVFGGGGEILRLSDHISCYALDWRGHSIALSARTAPDDVEPEIDNDFQRAQLEAAAAGVLTVGEGLAAIRAGAAAAGVPLSRGDVPDGYEDYDPMVEGHPA